MKNIGEGEADERGGGGGERQVELANGTTAWMAGKGKYIIRIKIHSSCEIEDLVETHLSHSIYTTLWRILILLSSPSRYHQK